MGRPPGNGSPAFRFSSNEVTEMETILRENQAQVPSREALDALAAKFSSSDERKGKMPVQMKQVWNWFQNRRYALRSKQTMSPPVTRLDPNAVRNVPQASNAVRNVPQASNAVRSVPQAPLPVTSSVAAQGNGSPISDNAVMEFEARSARDGAWYDVAEFLDQRFPEPERMEVLVRFAGFGAEEDEWLDVRQHVRHRSLPCESTECVAILPGDLILCFQEGKEQALYYDAHVIDSQRRRHDVRGCRCRFLVRYDHDQSEEIVPLKKVCRRPETDYRLLQLQSMDNGGTPHTGSSLRVYPPSEPSPNPRRAEEFPSHANRHVPTEVKIQQKRNPQVTAGGGVTINPPPAVPPGFEGVASGASGAPATNNQVEVKSSVAVITPVAEEVKSSEIENPEVVTPVVAEAKTLQTKDPKVGAVSVMVVPVVPPGFEAMTGGAMINNTSTDTPVGVEVNTEISEVDAGNIDAPVSNTVTNSTASGETPLAEEIKSLELKNTEVSAGEAMKIPIVPPGFEVMNNGSAPVTMEIESLETENPEVAAGDEAVTGGAIPSSNANASEAMEADTPNAEVPEINAGDAVKTPEVDADVAENMLEG